MPKLRFALPIVLFCLSSSAQEASPVPDIEELLKKSEEAIKKVNDYTGTMHTQERIEGKIVKFSSRYKFQRPFKVYLYYTKPKDQEVLFAKGWNDNELKAHPGSFPDITLNLDPFGGTAMDDNHHSILDFGQENSIAAMAKSIRKAIKRKEGEVKVTDGGNLFGQPVWKIEANYPKGGHNTTAKDDETLWDISRRTGQDMYIIMYVNKDYDDPDDPDEGDKVFIPRYYGSRQEFHISKETGMILKESTWDWNGRLYETYEYPDMKLNVGLTKKDFDPDNPKYDF